MRRFSDVILAVFLAVVIPLLGWTTWKTQENSTFIAVVIQRVAHVEEMLEYVRSDVREIRAIVGGKKMYSDQSDVEKIIPKTSLAQLTDDKDGTVVDSAIVASAIMDADTEIDAYLRQRYTLPLANTPSILRQISVDFVAWNLYSRRAESEMPGTIQSRRKNAVKLLEKIRNGQISLGTEKGQTPESGRYVVSKRHRIFGEVEF